MKPIGKQYGGNKGTFGSGGVGANYFDQPNLPDYANTETANRISTATGAWANDKGNGFVYAAVHNGNFSSVANIYINDKEVCVARGGSSAGNTASGVYAVKNGDVVRLSGNNNPYCFFIPPQSTGKQLQTLSCRYWRRVV